MSIQVKGTVTHKDIGVGTWALVSDTGETYELTNPPSELLNSGTKCSVEGVIRDDVMSMAMIGPILEVKSFTLLD